MALYDSKILLFEEYIYQYTEKTFAFPPHICYTGYEYSTPNTPPNTQYIHTLFPLTQHTHIYMHTPYPQNIPPQEASSSPNTLSDLYTQFQEQLSNPTTAFQDAALKTAITIEETIQKILSHESHPIDPRRIRRYGLDTEKPNPLHTTLAQEAQVLKDIL